MTRVVSQSHSKKKALIILNNKFYKQKLIYVAQYLRRVKTSTTIKELKYTPEALCSFRGHLRAIYMRK